MPFDGSGVFNFSGANFPYVTGQIVDATKQTANANDIANGLTNCLTKDGQTTPTANIPMGGKKITGLAVATADGDALSTISGGDLSIPGTFSAVGLLSTDDGLEVGGVGVVGARRIGWTAATGVATRTTFDTTTVTHQQLAERLKAVLDDLIAHGLIGP